MDPRMVPKGGSDDEFNWDSNAFGNRGRAHEPGVYFHPQAQKFIETARVQTADGSVAYHPDQGKIQGDAFAQIGYRLATKDELKEYRAKQKEAAEAKRRNAGSKTTVLASAK